MSLDIMKAECEIVAKKILPVLRAKVARNLSRDYGLQQHEISKKLGVTQAAVSFYLSKSRGSNTSIIRKFPEINVSAKQISAALYKNAKEKKIRDLLCQLCKKIKNKKTFKAMMKQ